MSGYHFGVITSEREGVGAAINGARPRQLALALDRVGIVVSALLALLFAALYAWAAIQRHDHYQSATFDLGLLTQVTWNTLHGHWFATTIMDFTYLAEHFSPALVLLSPLFLLWSDTRVLLIAQAAAVSLAGVGIYLTARQRTRDPLSALLLQAVGCLQQQRR